ncbi:MAG: GNAT family N-acetyltransferase [Oscillospiraceae bacterium]|nr:GNAT family N-acetyltransferase [Oscillospiraceae bacterium]
MNIDFPKASQYPALKALWAEAFGDEESFIDLFFATGFSPDRCRCITINSDVAAALYWFDCEAEGGKLAYLYAVATAKAHQGKGLCRALTEDTHAHLKARGYAGAILVPAEPSLFAMYGKMGYQNLSCMNSFSCTAAGICDLRPAAPEGYAAARNALLPTGGVRQAMGISYLAGYAELYIGADFTLAGVRKGDTFIAMELLGNKDAAPAILGALGLKQGSFRTPGSKPFAMYHSLSESPAPTYFGLAFD